MGLENVLDRRIKADLRWLRTEACDVVSYKHRTAGPLVQGTTDVLTQPIIKCVRASKHKLLALSISFTQLLFLLLVFHLALFLFCFISFWFGLHNPIHTQMSRETSLSSPLGLPSCTNDCLQIMNYSQIMNNVIISLPAEVQTSKQFTEPPVNTNW